MSRRLSFPSPLKSIGKCRFMVILVIVLENFTIDCRGKVIRDEHDDSVLFTRDNILNRF